MMGIELLVRLNDGPAGRKRGDVVSVKECPCKWGYCECPPTFIVVHIEDADKAQVVNFKGRHILLDHLDKSDKPVTVRSRFRMNLDKLPKDYKMVAPHLTISKVTAVTKVIDRRIEDAALLKQ